MQRSARPGAAVLAPGAFYGRVERQWRGDLVTLSVVRHDQARAVPEHAHRHAFITLLLGGQYEEEVDGRRIVYTPWSLVFHPERLVHKDAIGAGGALFFAVELGPALLRERVPLRSSLRSIRDLSGGPAVWTMLELMRGFLAGEAAALALEDPIAELLDALAGTDRRLAAREPRWLERTQEALEQRFARPLSLAELAHEAGVHPVHLSRVYRQRRGQSLRTALHRLRVREACRLLQEGAALSEVALLTGFTDQSHLTHVFRKVTGSTPGALRRALQAAGGARAPS